MWRSPFTLAALSARRSRPFVAPQSVWRGVVTHARLPQARAVGRLAGSRVGSTAVTSLRRAARFSTTPAGAAKSPGLWQRYVRALDTHPKTTKALSAAVLFASGDVLAQYVEQWKKEGFTLDTGRSIRSLVFGLCFSGIMNHYHLGFLDYLFTRGAFSSVPKALAPFGKLFIDQFVYFGYLIVGSYFVVMGLMEGKTGDEIQSNIKENFWPTIRVGWTFWIPVQLVGFNFVPVQLQTTYVLCATFAWVVILSIKYTTGLDAMANKDGSDGPVVEPVD